MEDRRVWTLYKDDFLIWAMHFTLWVASSNRRLCIDKKILLNELTELEFFGHSTDFYSFYPLDNFLSTTISVSWMQEFLVNRSQIKYA